MAAPSYVYFGESMNFPSSNGTIQVFIPRLLKNSVPTIGDEWGDGYYNEGDDDATIETKICHIFKLDKFTRTLFTGQQGFVGTVMPGSPNAAFHNENRFTGATDFKDGQDYVMLNDGGLNRRGEAYLGANISQPKWVNWSNFAYEIRSAFYNNSTDVGYSFRINGSGWTDVSFGIQPPAVKVIIDDVYKHIDFTPTAQTGDTIGLRVWIENGEGKTYSTEYSFTAEEALAIPTGAQLYDTPNGNIVGTVTLFMLASTEPAISSVTTLDSATGLFVFLSEYFTTSNPTAGHIAANGWYLIGGIPSLPNGNVKVFRVENGELRRYEERTPVYPKIVFTCINNGQPDFPQYRAQATIQDDTNPPTGFTQSLNTQVTVRYLDNSEQLLASYTASMNITQGGTVAYSPIISLPPEGTTKVQVLCAANEATLGMPKLEPITPLPPA